MTNELYHYGVPGMKWGHRKASRTLNKNLRKAFKAQDAYSKSIRVSSVGSVTIYDVKKRKNYDRAREKVNSYMDKLDKLGYNWRYDSNYGVTGRLTETGRGYVETTVNGVTTRKNFN